MVTPIMAAVQNGHLSCVSLLTQFGADVNYVDPCGQITCLHLAVYTNNPEIVHFLLTSSLTSSNDVNARSLDGRVTSLALAIENMGYSKSPFPKDCSVYVENTKARQDKCLAILQMLLDAGADVNDSPVGSLPLAFTSATATDTRVIELFIHYGLDVNMQIQTNTLHTHHLWQNYIASDSELEPVSLLTYYLAADYYNVAELLVKYGAIISSKDHGLILTAHGQKGQLPARLLTNHMSQCLQSLYSHVTRAPQLRWLCRQTIRCKAGIRLRKDIQCLPLPTALKLYLMGYEE